MRFAIRSTALFLSLVSALAGGSPAFAQQNESQLRNLINSRNKYFSGARQARNRGLESIGRGTRHMRHGRSHHHPPEVRTGALEVANGILGLLAAAAADRMGNKDEGNAGNLDQITGLEGDAAQSSTAASGAADGAVSGDSASTSLASGSLSAKDGSGKTDLEQIAKDPGAREALKEIEAEYGYSPKEFVEKLDKDRNPEQLFTNAPLNPMMRAEAREAQKSVSEQMAASSLTNETPTPAAAPAPQVASQSIPLGSDRNALRDSLARRLAGARTSQDGDDDLELSPEVRKALAQKDADERAQAARDARNNGEINLFEVVHLKYLEREKNLRYGEPLRSASLY